MEMQTVGEGIVAARAFLSEVHDQLQSLIETMDGILAARGWKPTNANVTNNVGAALNSKRWMVSYLYRFYFPTDATSDRVVGLVVYLDPPECSNRTEPVCLAFDATFGKRQTHDSIFDGWESSEDLVAALKDRPEAMYTATGDEYRRFLPNATHVRAFMLPLCSLAYEDDLRVKVVERILAN